MPNHYPQHLYPRHLLSLGKFYIQMRKTLGADQDIFSVSDSSKKCSGDWIHYSSSRVTIIWPERKHLLFQQKLSLAQPWWDHTWSWLGSMVNSLCLLATDQDFLCKLGMEPNMFSIYHVNVRPSKVINHLLKDRKTTVWPSNVVPAEIVQRPPPVLPWRLWWWFWMRSVKVATKNLTFLK